VLARTCRFILILKQLNATHIFPSHSCKDQTIILPFTHIGDQYDLLLLAFPPQILYVYVIPVFVLFALLTGPPECDHFENSCTTVSKKSLSLQVEILSSTNWYMWWTVCLWTQSPLSYLLYMVNTMFVDTAPSCLFLQRIYVVICITAIQRTILSEYLTSHK
jgi:hypothetical protein